MEVGRSKVTLQFAGKILPAELFWLMTEKRFAEALALMKHYMEIDTAIVGLHRNLMLCDMVYCELIGENRGDVVSELLGREQKKFMKAMRNYPAVLRTEYTCAMLDRYDPKKAERAEKQFELIAKTYPYESDIEANRALGGKYRICGGDQPFTVRISAPAKQ